MHVDKTLLLKCLPVHGPAGSVRRPGRAANVAAVNTTTGQEPAAGWTIREAGPEDWPGIWAILEPVVRSGETFTWDRDTAEDEARARWFKLAPGRTFVAVASDTGAVLGTGELHPNQGGGGSHVANAGYMVHPAQAGRGLARALCAYSLDAARDAGFRAMQFNAVVESNVRAVAAWKSMGFEVLATIPEAFNHPELGYVGLHVMYRKL